MVSLVYPRNSQTRIDLVQSNFWLMWMGLNPLANSPTHAKSMTSHEVCVKRDVLK